MIEYRQAGHRFDWPPGYRFMNVYALIPGGDPFGRLVDQDVGIGNIFDSAPATLDEIQDAIDAWCAANADPKEDVSETVARVHKQLEQIR